MTVDDKKPFAQAFNRLVKAGVIHDVDAATMAVYFATLADLPLSAVEEAEAQLRRSAPPFFNAAAWHKVAYSIVLARKREEDRDLASRRLTTGIHCAECQDTGWRGDPAVSVTACDCRSTNPNYQAIQARGRLIGEGEVMPPSPKEAGEAIERVRDFKRLGSGE